MNNFVEEDFDLVLLDIQMPEIDGYQVFKALRSREKYRQVPIVAMTANVFTKDRESMINEGFNGVLLKPFNEAELVKIIVDFVKPQKEDVLLSSSERLSPSPSGES